jgi:hypothetical protein
MQYESHYLSEVDSVEFSVGDTVDVCPPGEPSSGDPLSSFVYTDGLVVVFTQM